MIVAVMIFGAAVGLAAFAFRMFLPRKAIVGYDRGALALFRWIAFAGVATIAAAGAYAVLIAR